VAVITFSTCSSVTVRGQPGRGSSLSPSSRDARNRDRYFDTVALELPRPAATSLTVPPAAQASTIRTAAPAPARSCGAAPIPQDLPLLIGQHDRLQLRGSL